MRPDLHIAVNSTAAAQHPTAFRSCEGPLDKLAQDAIEEPSPAGLRPRSRFDCFSASSAVNKSLNEPCCPAPLVRPRPLPRPIFRVPFAQRLAWLVSQTPCRLS